MEVVDFGSDIGALRHVLDGLGLQVASSPVILRVLEVGVTDLLARNGLPGLNFCWLGLFGLPNFGLEILLQILHVDLSPF